MRAKSRAGEEYGYIMIPERWQQIDRVFQAALEREPGERMAFLDDACAGDEELRKEVEALISCDDRQEFLIDAPVFEAAASLFVSDQPELAAGQQVGHYKVLSLLGTGGMGEVYLAQDMTLGRKIALKLLPADFTIDETRVQRFQQEARAASMLNHPNILTIHEICQFDGRHFIAAEFIEGETLRACIKRAELSLLEKLDISMQAANALVAAHQAGIVHRDIKPENIMIRTDGYVKVLDFGLAKLTELQAGGEENEVPTIETITTHHSLIMGTLNYMSPEQARGVGVDARSDLFSLGVVVYEMVAGRAPFEGKTPSDLIDSILKVEPPPITDYLPNVPVELQRIISKALCKDKEGRYQTAKTLLVDLRTLKRNLESRHDGEAGIITIDFRQADQTGAQIGATTANSKAPGASASPPVAPIIPYSRKTVTILSLMIIFFLGLVGYTVSRLIRQNTSVPFRKFQTTKITTNGKSRDAAISPDGKYVAYVVEDTAQESVWVKQIKTNSASQIVPPGAGRCESLTFSPDCNYIYYVRYDEKNSQANALYQVSVLGGPSTKVISEVHSPISFAPDGKHFAFFRRLRFGNLLMLANADGTEERELVRRKFPNDFWDNPCGPAWSPGGEVIACGVANTENDRVYAEIIEVRVQDGEQKIISSGDWQSMAGIAWLTDGTGLLISAVNGPRPPGYVQVWHVAYPGGEVQRITSDVTDYEGMSLTKGSRAIVATQNDFNMNLWIAPNGETSRAKPIISGNNPCYGICWTPEGRIVYAPRASNNIDIWLMDQDGTNQKQLTINSGQNSNPSVSPDGRYVVFESTRSGTGCIWRMNSDGSNAKQLTSGILVAPSCSPDGKWVRYCSLHPDLGWWKVPIDGGDPVRITDDDSVLPVISPDGKFIAYMYRYGHGNPPIGIAIAPLEGGGPVRRFPILQGLSDSDNQLEWTRDGSAVMYIVTHGGVSNLWGQPTDGGPQKQLTDFKSETIYSYDESYDGKQLALIRGSVITDVVLINNIE